MPDRLVGAPRGRRGASIPTMASFARRPRSGAASVRERCWPGRVVGAMVGIVLALGLGGPARAAGADGGDAGLPTSDASPLTPSTNAHLDGPIVDAATPRAAPPPTGGYDSVVRAARVTAGTAREDSAASSSVVRPADGPRVGADLATLMMEVPGANVTRRGGFGSFATLSLRGSNPDEVRVYLDGVPLNQAVGGAVDLSTLPMGDVDTVEIYRGMTPIAFGESALGGVVSISTRAPDRNGLTARAGVGSFGTGFGDLAAAVVAKPFTVYAGAHVISATGDFPVQSILSPTGARENNDLFQVDGSLRATWTLPGRRELRAGFVGFRRDQGVPTSDLFHSIDARAQSSRAIADIGYSSRSDLGERSRLRAVLFASVTQEHFSDPLYKIVGVPTDTRDLTQSAGASVTFEKSVARFLGLSGVVEARAESYRPRNEANPTMPAGYPANREVLTAGWEADAWIAPADLHILPSARLEAARDVRTGRDPTFGTYLLPAAPTDRVWPVFRLAVRRPIGEAWQLRANAGRYQRIPAFVELYGFNQGFVGNPQLRAERGFNADAGVTFHRLRRDAVGETDAEATASMTCFAARVDDLIGWETFSYATRAENVSRARIAGAELELRARAGRGTMVSQATLTDARDEGPDASRHDRQLAHHPRYRGYLRGEWRQPVGIRGGAIILYADADATAGDSLTTGPYGALPPRLFVGAGMAVELGSPAVRLSASGYNLLDSRVEDFSGYPLPGRAVLVALSWSPLPAALSDSNDPTHPPNLATNR